MVKGTIERITVVEVMIVRENISETDPLITSSMRTPRFFAIDRYGQRSVPTAPITVQAASSATP